MNNLSTVSVYDNVPGSGEERFSDSCVYRTINDLLSINGDVESIIFCPLCVNTFEYKFSLFEHLRKFHHGFIINVSDKCLRFKECPFCSAKFYGKRLTAKHSLLHHSKVIKELFVGGDSKCTFCGSELNSKDLSGTIKHIEKMHFTHFEKEFRKKFSTSVSEMTFSEFINSTVSNNEMLARYNWDDMCGSIIDNHSRKKELLFSSPNKIEEAHKVNCFDFSDIKNQLKNIKNCQNMNEKSCDFKNRSILKSLSRNKMQKSVRRVLKFDLPDLNNENKENSKINCDLVSFEQVSHEKPTLFYDVNKLSVENLRNLPEDGCMVPKYCSTPNHMAHNVISRMPENNNCRKIVRKTNEIFLKSSVCFKNDSKFDFQCGKCRKLFKENLELVCHLKNNHKMFDLNIFKPCFRCAICNARFFKNYYLKKHHRIHEPY